MSKMIATRASAGEGGGRPGGSHAQFPQAASLVEVGLRDEREARGPVARGLCTIGSSPSESMTVGYTGEHTAMYAAFGHKVRVWAWARCAARLAHARRP